MVQARRWEGGVGAGFSAIIRGRSSYFARFFGRTSPDSKYQAIYRVVFCIFLLTELII